MPPFDEETARKKVKAAQDAWNTRDPEKVSLVYTEDSKWRNRDEYFEGREDSSLPQAQVGARTRLQVGKASLVLHREPHRRQVRVRVARPGGQWWRSHGNELWEFEENGLMGRRDASINDYKIEESERRIF